jgi:hypothetical protein
MILILLVGALIIWAFALWSFSSTLNVSYNPLRFLATLSTSFSQGLSVGQVVPALLMLVLIVATPLLIWNLLEEWAASYTPTPTGLRFESLGIAISYPWESISSLRQVDDDSDEPLDELVISRDYTAQIGNPLLRFLHSQAYGRQRLPIYAGIEGRDELLATIRQHIGPTPAAQPEAAAQI